MTNAKIFATVGAQMGFDRMIRAVDAWASENPHIQVFAQIGNGEYEPTAMEWTRLLEPPEFRARVESASAIVGHAGMGTIITALQHAKPVLIMPRRGDLQETRNDHQIATAERFGVKAGVSVAMDEHSLPEALDSILKRDAPDRLSNEASAELIDTVRRFIRDGESPAGPSHDVVPAKD